MVSQMFGYIVINQSEMKFKEQEKRGEPMVSQKRNEGAQLVAAPEAVICRMQGL